MRRGQLPRIAGDADDPLHVNDAGRAPCRMVLRGFCAGARHRGHLAARFKLFRDRRYAEAVEIAERSLSMAERRWDVAHSNIARSVANLALAYVAVSRRADAERLFRRCVALFDEEKAKSDQMLTDFVQDSRLLTSKP